LEAIHTIVYLDRQEGKDVFPLTIQSHLSLGFTLIINKHRKLCVQLFNVEICKESRRRRRRRVNFIVTLYYILLKTKKMERIKNRKQPKDFTQD
jgi:hypothetical protein